MNNLLINAQKLLKEEIKGKSSYDNFMSIINPMFQQINQDLNSNPKAQVSFKDLNLIYLKSRLNDIKFDVRSLKREVSYNNGQINFDNVDTYDDYAIEDIFKNTHILVDTLKKLN